MGFLRMTKSSVAEDLLGLCLYQKFHGLVMCMMHNQISKHEIYPGSRMPCLAIDPEYKKEQNGAVRTPEEGSQTAQ